MGSGGFMPAAGITRPTRPSSQKATRKATSQTTNTWTFCIQKCWNTTASGPRTCGWRERGCRGTCDSVGRGVWYAPAQAVDRPEEFRYGYVWRMENHALVSFIQVSLWLQIYASHPPSFQVLLPLSANRDRGGRGRRYDRLLLKSIPHQNSGRGSCHTEITWQDVGFARGWVAKT